MPLSDQLILNALAAVDARWTALTQSEHQELLSRWIAIYGTINEPCWNVKSGERAILLATEACDGAFFVVPCRDSREKGWRAVGGACSCLGEKLPDLWQASHYVDMFVSPEDLSWTLYYGHEVDVFGGPDFARAEWMRPENRKMHRRRECR